MSRRRTWGGSSAAVGMAADPVGAHQAGVIASVALQSVMRSAASVDAVPRLE